MADKMTAENIVKSLRELLPPKIDYAELVGAEGCHYGHSYVWEDPEPYVMEAAADFIEILQDENERLNQHGMQYMKIAETRSELVEKYGAELEDIQTKYYNAKAELCELQSKIKELEVNRCKNCKYHNTTSSTKYPCNHCSWCYTSKFKTKE